MLPRTLETVHGVLANFYQLWKCSIANSPKLLPHQRLHNSHPRPFLPPTGGCPSLSASNPHRKLQWIHQHRDLLGRLSLAANLHVPRRGATRWRTGESSPGHASRVPRGSISTPHPRRPRSRALGQSGPLDRRTKPISTADERRLAQRASSEL